MKEIGKKLKKTNRHGAVHKACAAALCTAMLLILGGCGADPGKEPAKVEGRDVTASGQAGSEGADAAASGSTGGNSQPGEAPSTGSMHISGDITDVGDGSFTVSVEMDNTAEYGEALSGETKNTEIVSLTVYYTQDTQFVINSVSSNGASSSQAEGTAADLDNGLMVILDGTRTGDDFKADKVAIFHFGNQ